MAWKRVTWVDDDGSLTVGTLFDASHMNNIEDGIEGLELLLPGKQPLDSDLTAIAALTTTEFGRSFLVLAGASAARTLLGLGTAAVEPSSAFQPADSDLTAIAALTTTSFGRSVLTQATAEATRTLLGLGTAATKASGEFQAADSDLTAIAALATTEFGRSLLTQASAAAARSTLGLGTAAVEPSSAFQPADSDLTAIAALTTTSVGRSLLAIADAAAGRTILGAASLVALEAEALARETADAEFPKGLIVCRLATDEALPAHTRSTNKIEANVNGALPIIDLAIVAVGNYILLKNGAAKADNGVYKVISVGSAGTKWSMERVPELDASADAVSGLIVSVAEGARNSDRQYSLATDSPITLNTTSLEFSLVASRNWGLVSSLPLSKVLLVGDTCSFYADKANGVVWDLIYDAEGEFPWKKKGGPPIFAEVVSEEKTSSTTYVNLTTVGPQVTSPLKGDYLIAIGAELWNTTANDNASMSYAIGAAAAEAGDALLALQSSAITSIAPGGSRKVRKTLAASAALIAKYKVNAAEATFRKRWIELDAVRVG